MNQKHVGYVLTVISIVIIIALFFTKINVDKQEVYLCKLIEENPSKTMDECPAHDSGVSWFILGAFVLISIMLAIGILLIFTPPTVEKSEEYKKIDESKLSEEEKQVIGFLKEKEGSAYQSDLIKETGHSKVKITRVLDKLEGKGILEKKRRGMTNIIVLK